MSQTLQQDLPSVTPEGFSLTPRIDGVRLRKPPIQEDPRGELIEVFCESWNFHPDPLVYAYYVLARPKSIRAWIVHAEQDDRLFCFAGVFHWVLFDDRPDSPTKGLLNHFTFGKRNPTLLTIPKGVYHGVQNVGTEDAMFLNLPTKPYNHTSPDKYRLPNQNSTIPFAFPE